MTLIQELLYTQVTINSQHKRKKRDLGTNSMPFTQQTILMDFGAHKLQGKFQVPKERITVSMLL